MVLLHHRLKLDVETQEDTHGWRGGEVEREGKKEWWRDRDKKIE
jgi:hypothetical protein